MAQMLSVSSGKGDVSSIRFENSGRKKRFIGRVSLPGYCKRCFPVWRCIIAARREKRSQTLTVRCAGCLMMTVLR